MAGDLDGCRCRRGVGDVWPCGEVRRAANLRAMAIMMIKDGGGDHWAIMEGVNTWEETVLFFFLHMVVSS